MNNCFNLNNILHTIIVRKKVFTGIMNIHLIKSNWREICTEFCQIQILCQLPVNCIQSKIVWNGIWFETWHCVYIHVICCTCTTYAYDLFYSVHVQVCKCDIPYLYRDQYSDILTRQWVDIFNEIFDEDNYTPIYVESVEEYTAIVTQFPFQDEELEQVRLYYRYVKCINGLLHLYHW